MLEYLKCYFAKPDSQQRPAGACSIKLVVFRIPTPVLKLQGRSMTHYGCCIPAIAPLKNWLAEQLKATSLITPSGLSKWERGSCESAIRFGKMT